MLLWVPRRAGGRTVLTALPGEQLHWPSCTTAGCAECGGPAHMPPLLTSLSESYSDRTMSGREPCSLPVLEACWSHWLISWGLGCPQCGSLSSSPLTPACCSSAKSHARSGEGTRQTGGRSVGLGWFSDHTTGSRLLPPGWCALLEHRDLGFAANFTLAGRLVIEYTH